MWPTSVVPDELPLPPTELINQDDFTYKATPCRYFQAARGECRFGSTCRFAHGFHEQRRPGYGPTLEEAEQLGRPLPPALQAWWHQARANMQRGNVPVPHQGQRPRAASASGVNGQAVTHVGEDEALRLLREQFPDEYQRAMEQQGHYNGAAPPTRRSGPGDARNLASGAPPFPNPHAYSQAPQRPMVQQQQTYQQPVYQQPQHVPQPYQQQMHPQMRQHGQLQQPQQLQQSGTGPDTSADFRTLLQGVTAFNQELESFLSSPDSMTTDLKVTSTLWAQRRNYYRKLGLEMADKIMALGVGVADLEHTDPVKCEELRRQRAAVEADYMVLAPLLKQMVQLWKPVKKRLDEAIAAAAAAPAPVVAPQAVPATYLQPKAVANAFANGSQMHTSMAGGTPATQYMGTVQAAANGRQAAPAVAATPALPAPQAIAPVAQQAARPTMVGTVTNAAKSVFNATMQAAASASTALFTGDAVPPPRAAPVQPAPQPAAAKPAAPQAKEAPTRPTVVPNAAPTVAAAQPVVAAAGPGKANVPGPAGAATPAAPATAAPAPAAPAAAGTDAASKKVAAGKAAKAAAPIAASAQTAAAPAAKQGKPGAGAADASTVADQLATASAQRPVQAGAGPSAAVDAAPKDQGVSNGQAVVGNGQQAIGSGQQRGNKGAAKAVQAPPAPPAPPPPKVYSEEIVTKGEKSLTLLRTLHDVWAALFTPIVSAPQPAAVVKAAVDVLTGQLKYKSALSAVKYLTSRHKTLTLLYPASKEYVYSLGITDEYLMDGMPNWRNAPPTVRQYVAALLWEVAATDEPELLERLDTYMDRDENQAWLTQEFNKPLKDAEPLVGAEPALVKGCWKSFKQDKTGSFVANLVKNNKHKVLEWALSKSKTIEELFALDKDAWRPVANTNTSSTGMYAWAKSLGGGAEAIVVMMKPWSDEQKEHAKQQAEAEKQARLQRMAKPKPNPTVVKEQFALIHSLVTDGLQPEVVGEALKFALLSVQWTPEQGSLWTVDAGKPCSFLHFVLHMAHPDQCAGLVQVAVDKLMDELKQSGSPTPTERKQNVSFYVRQKDHDGRAPLMIAIERCSRLSALTRHLPAVLLALLIHGADPLCDNFQQLVDTTPMHTLILKVDKGVVDVDTGAKALFHMAKYSRPQPKENDQPADDDGLDNVIVTNSSQYLMNVLAAAINSTAGPQRLVEALITARPDINPAKLLQFDGPPGQDKVYQTPLAMALVAKPPRPARPEMAKQLLTCWRPEMLLDAMDARQSPEIREEVKRLLQANNEAALKPLAALEEAELKPLLDAALGEKETHLLELVLKNVPQARFESLDLVNRNVPIECMMDLARRGAHAHLGKTWEQLPADVQARFEAKLAFLQNLLDSKLALYPADQVSGTCTLPNDQVVYGQRWQAANDSRFSYRERESFKLMRLLSVNDQDNIGPLSEVYLPRCRASVACMFGRGLGAGKSTTELLKQMLQAGTVDPNERDPSRCGMTLLHLAAADSAAEAVKALVMAGADVMARIMPRPGAAEGDAAADKKGAKKGTSSALNAIHDALTDFLPLHIAAKVLADMVASYGQPIQSLSKEEVADLLECHTNYVDASGRQVFEYLMDKNLKDQCGLRAPLSKGKKGLTARGLLGPSQNNPLVELYDAIYTPAAARDKERQDKADKAALKHSAPVSAATTDVLAAKNSQGVKQRVSMPIDRQEQVEKDLHRALVSGGTADGMDISAVVTIWASLPLQKQEASLVDILVKTMSADTAAAGSTAGEGADGAELTDAERLRAVSFSAVRQVIDDMLPDDSHQWTVDDDVVPDDPNAVYSDDDVPEPEPLVVAPAKRAANNPQIAAQELDLRSLDTEALLQDLDWMFTITKEARQSWASLEPFAKRLVLKRLQEIGRGMWQRSGGVKRLPPESDQLRGLDLWRLKINKAGRILFEVAVEYYEEKDCWSECIRLWCITLNHKKYEECIVKVHDSYRRSQQVNEKRKLQALWPDAGGGGGVHESEDAVRKPRTFQDNSLDRNQLMAMGPTAAEGKRADRPKATGPERDHLPPANYDPEQFTLLKMYNVDSVLLQTVMHRLTDAQVELPFKVSPVEWEIITQVPRPPCSTILLGRSGTGKTTCAVYRMWGKWLSGYKQWVPGQQALAAAGAGDAARAMGDVEGADALAEFAARTVGGTTIFVTASATLKETVRKAFRKMQKAAMKPDEYKAVEEAGRVVYHSFRNVPPEAFPLFLTSRQYLEMVDASTAWPFFKRRADGSIIKPQDPDQLDNDSPDIVMNLEFDQDEGEDDYEDEDEAGNAVAEAEAEEEEENQEQVVIDHAAGGIRDEGVIYQRPIKLAGKVTVDKEVTWLFFRNEMWPKITTPEQRVRLQPALVWAEICSYIKGSMQAIDTEDWGHLTLDDYKNIGDKRAANFTKEEREHVIWPIFQKYQKVKGEARRYDMMDFVSHIYNKLKETGYQGVPISSLYRDEVQDFTQAELALDLKVVADPNSLFYCGDTAQTIARGVGFRFKDITHLLYTEGKKREAAHEALRLEGRRRQAVIVGQPQIQHLTTNYRTHQGILNTAAMVVDLLKTYYPYSIDKLQREKALFPGPHPILLAGTESTDLTYLLVGTDRSNSQVEFGANQVILVRTMAAQDELPEEIRQSNALIMTVPQAKGLEFDDVFLFNFFKDSVADAAEWRVLNEFVKDFGEGKDYALKAASDNPELLQRYKEHHQQAYTEMVQKEGSGYLRPTTFARQQHVLLQEELKHLYTAITRAKSNVVFFDLDKEKRAPFYNVLRSFGMARVVNRSLLDDGADAKEFGLVHTAKDSKQEWYKRAKGLMEKRSPGLAAKAFLQAGDHVRASAALARHLRMEATGEADQDQHTQRAPLTQEEKRRKLLEVAFRSLVAVQRAGEAPNPVTRAELKRWVRLAAQCLTEIKLPAAAAQLHALVHGYKTARTILQALGEFRALAVVCIQACHYYAGQAARAKAAAQSARSHLLVAGKDLASMLEDDAAGQARIAHQEEAEEKERAAASATKLAEMYRARAAHAYWLADDLEQSLRLLHAHGISREVLQVWPNVHKDLLKMSQVLQDVGKRAEARIALDLAPDSKDKEEQCKRFGMWDEVTAMRMRRGDVLGVVRVLMGQRQHLAAAQKLLDLMIARGARLQGESASSAANLQFPAVDPALATVADQPVPAEAFSLLATCTLALQSRGDVALLPLQLALPAAEEVGARAELDTLIGLAWVMEGMLPDGQGGARSAKAQTRRPLDDTTKAVLLNAPGCVPFLEFQASVEQRLDVVARSLGLTSSTVEMPVLAQYIFECIQTGAIQVSQGTAQALASDAGKVALERLLQNLQLAATGLEGLAALQQMRQPTAEQQDALRHFELHYGVASRSPTAGVIRNLGATNLLSLDYSDVYLGNASYMWRSLAGMQPEPSATFPGSKAPPAPAPAWDTLADVPQFLPLRAPRPALLQLLAWDLTRKAHAALVPVLYQALVEQLADSNGPHGLLADLSQVKDRVDLLLSCLQACQRVQALCKMRNAILPVVQRPSSKKSTAGPARDVEVIPDSPIQPCSAAVQELTGAQEVVRQLEILCVGLLTASSSPTAHPSGFCKYLDSFKATELPRATMSTERFGAALFRVFDAGYPGHGRWQGVNFACWWGYTMLLQHQGNAKKICQRQAPPATANRELMYILDEADERYMLPEEVLSVASQRMYNGMTDVGIASIATHVHHAVQQLRAQCSMQPSEAAPALPVHDHLTVEPVVLLLEMMGSVLTLSLPEAGTVGNKDLCIPRAYLPNVYVELVTDLPIWGVRQGINPTWRANDLVTFWQGGDEGTEFSKEQSVHLLYSVLKLIWMVAKLISAPGPALATMSQQQMLSLVSQHMARERGVSAEAAAAAAKPLVLPVAAQRVRGAVLALRLVRLTASMLLTLEISHGTASVCGKPKQEWPGILAKDVREVLSRLQPVLETPEAVAALPDMRSHAENLKAFLAAAKVGELTKAAHKLLGTITEVTPDHVREYTGNMGSAWKQVQSMLVYMPPPTAPKSGPAGKKSGPAQQEDVPSGMAGFDRAQQSQATFASSNKKKEQDIQSAIVIQDAWRKYRAARQAEQARLDLEARRSVLLETMQDLYQRSPSIRRNFAAMRARALAVLEERRMQQLHAARQQLLAEEAKKSDLLAAIRTHRTALDDVDGRLGSVGLASASCPVCPVRPITVLTPQHKVSSMPQRAAVVPGVTPPPLRAIPAQQGAAGAADTPTSPPSGGKSWADRAAIHAVPPPSTRLIKAAMRPMVVQTHAEHTSLPSHAAALEKFKAFRDSYLFSVCSCMWWVEVLRVAADKAVQGLKEEPEAGAEAKADQVAVMTALATQKGHLAEVPDLLQFNLVRPALQSREWNVGACDQFAMQAARVAVIAAKKLVEAGQAERLCAAIAAGRQGNADWLPVADASELEAQEQAIKAGEMPLSLVRLAQTLLGEAEVNRLLGRQVAASEPDASRPPEGASSGGAAAEAPTSVGAAPLPVLAGWAAAAAVGATKAGGLAGDADEAMLLGQAAMDVTDEELISAMARKQEEDERDEEEEDEEEEEWETVTKGRKQGGKGGMRGAVGGGGSGPNAQANRRRAGPSQNRFQGPRGGGGGAGPGGGAQAQARRAGR